MQYEKIKIDRINIMKKIIFFTIISCLMFNSIGNAQTDIAMSKIAIIARYTDEGLELR